MILLRHALLPFCLIFFSSYSAAAFDLVKRSWCHFQMPNLDLISDLPPDQAEALLVRLERFDRAASALLEQGDAVSRPRLKVLVFAKRRDFERVFDSPSFAGFMCGSIYENLLAVGADSAGEHLVGNLMHEYVHHMLRNDPRGAWPLWYEEGLASFLATLTVNERGVVVGATTKHQPERLHRQGYWDEHEVRYLDAPTSLPDGDTVWLRDLLATGSSADARGTAIHDFYQRSWLLVHLLRHGHLAGFADRRSVLDAYLEVLRAGGEPVQSFVRLLDENLVELARDFGRYRHRGRFPIQEIALSLPAPSAVVTVGCLESGEVAYQLGMASSTIHPGFARDAFDWLVERSSDDARPYVGYSVIERADGRGLPRERQPRMPSAVATGRGGVSGRIGPGACTHGCALRSRRCSLSFGRI